ncbi:MAG TPA: POTRA domain-containing protein, partial [Pyrinomonadaceae bacterium]|nr:POTRA domain-containing protein [Pyrinomonadaceae bacterium]
MKLTRPVEIDFLKKHRKTCKSISFSGFLFDLAFLCAFVSALTIFLSLSVAKAQTNYEGLPISGVDIEVENSTSQTSFTADQFEAIVRRTVGERFSAVKNREALQELFNSGRVATARVEVLETNASPRTIRLRFVVRRNTVVDRVTINIGESEGDEVTEEELLVRLNLLQPNAVLTQRALEESADIIQTYLRDRGFYKAEVTFSQQPGLRETRNIVTFNVNPNAQARIENFNINIAGFDAREVLDDINLKPGKTFTRAKLNEDLTRIRRALVKEDFLAADLSDPKVTFDAEKNTITIELTGNVGAKVNVEFRRAEIEDREIVEIKDEEIKISERTQRELLPIKREGDLDTSAITEGGRRLRNKFQEDGYFFAQVEAVCAVNPYLPEDANNFRNNTAAACDFVSGATLDGRTVEVIYAVDLNQRLRLTEIRIEGTDKLPVAEVKPALQSQEANALGIIPGLGYGRGYTSRELLAQDRGNIAVLMRELGYRKAKVTVRQGVSPDGENLIITFVVDEGPLSRVSGVDIVGNTRFTDAQLEAELPPLVGRELSRARARTGNDRILNLYAKEGFIEARSTFAIEEDQTTNAQGEEQVRIIYTLENEGEKAFINRIRTFGNVNTKRESILESIPLKPGDVLRADMITEAERNLY